MIEVSLFSNVSAGSLVGTCYIDRLFEGIRQGFFLGSPVKETIEELRQTGNKQLKLSLPNITWQGTFNYRNDRGMTSLSSLMCIDIDHKTTDELAELRMRLREQPWVMSFFSSPSGDGLKVIVKTDNYNPDIYKNCYRQLEKLFYDLYGIEPDDNCEAMSQTCFVSYDPDIFVRMDAQDLHLEYNPEFETAHEPHSTKPTAFEPQPLSKVQKAMNTLAAMSGGMSDEQVIAKLSYEFHRYPRNYQDGYRTRAIFSQARKLCLAGVAWDKAIDYLKKNFLPTGYDANKLVYEASRAYDKCEDSFGSERGIIGGV